MSENTKNSEMNDAQVKIRECLRADAEFAFIMGSFGTERFGPESDIDIAYYPKSGCEGRRFQLQLELETSLERDVDLISLKEVDPIFGRQVLETGRILMVSDPGLLLEWKARQLSTYPDFKRSREVIELHLLRRKKSV